MLPFISLIFSFWVSFPAKYNRKTCKEGMIAANTLLIGEVEYRGQWAINNGALDVWSILRDKLEEIRFSLAK